MHAGDWRQVGVKVNNVAVYRGERGAQRVSDDRAAFAYRFVVNFVDTPAVAVLESEPPVARVFVKFPYHVARSAFCTSDGNAFESRVVELVSGGCRRLPPLHIAVFPD
jgi:hypothetical protein